MTLPSIKHPLFTVVLPLSKKKITYRPFLVNEKKILMIANESGQKEDMQRAVFQVVQNCIVPSESVANWPTVDLHYMFYTIRSKSIGETADFILTCKGCKGKIPYTFDFTKIYVDEIDKNLLNIPIKDKIGVVMKFPDCSLEGKIPENAPLNEKVDLLLLNCIDYIYDENQIYYAKDVEATELKQFIDNLPVEVHNRMESSIMTSPKVKYKDTYVCKHCNAKDELKLDNLIDFFTSAALTKASNPTTK